MSAAAHAKTKLPQPERNEAWMKLCRDPNYRYKANDEQLYFAQDWLGENGKETIEYGPPPENMHRGALAPAWVFQATPLQEANDDLETYMRRLICALTGRFVFRGRMLPSRRICDPVEGFLALSFATGGGIGTMNTLSMK
jgi:hypothetical protein